MARTKPIKPKKRGRSRPPKAKAPRPAPKKKRTKTDERARLAGLSRQRNSLGRDMGHPKDIADPERRERCGLSLRDFCETYNRATFFLPWSDDQLESIARMEECVFQGALHAFAEPRGGGKTARCRMATLWALSYARRRYPVIIGATAAKAEDSLNAVKSWIRFLPLYVADFPDIAQAAQKLAGIANRAAGQFCGSEDRPTLIEWSQSRIILPTVPPPSNWPKHWTLRSDGMVPTAGALCSAIGLTADGIRGCVHTLSNGETIRPDLVVLDDPQTRESAISPAQNEARERMVSADVLGMAGPGKAVSAFMPCTVIAQDDFVDRILDRDKHPLWRGVRRRLLRSMPTNLAAWDGYFAVYKADAQREPPDFTASLAYYQANREELEAGAEASWPARKEAWEISAVQHAMHLYCRDPRAFASEYQNDPLPEFELTVNALSPDDVASRVNQTQRGIVTADAVRLTAGIDVQGELLYWLVCAWGDEFSGAIVDYGTFPGQERDYFTLRDAQRTLSAAYPTMGLEGKIYAGLAALTDKLFAREWLKASGQVLRLERGLIDANWGQSTETVYKFCRESRHASVLTPAHGMGIGASRNPISEWAVKKEIGERRGLAWVHWKQKRDLAHVTWDSNFWKSFLVSRLQTAPGDKGCLQICGKEAAEHRMLADHLTAEYPVPVEGRGRRLDEWRPKPGQDNHWLDCLLMAMVGASFAGVSLKEAGGPAPPKQRRKVDYAAMQKEQWAKVG